MYCEQCGAKLDESASFCRYCGAKQSGAVGSENTAPAQPEPRYYENATPAEPETKPAKEEKSSGKTMLYGLLMILLGAVLTGISYATNDYEYTVYTGLFLVGGITFLVGLAGMCKTK